jgi:hypothetical protein
MLEEDLALGPVLLEVGLLETGVHSRRFKITLGGVSINIMSNISGAEAAIDHTFGAHADIESGGLSDSPATDWSVSAFSAANYDRVLANLVDAPAGPPCAAGLAPYWRSDFDATTLRMSSTFAAVLHRAPFTGVTLFDAQARNIIFIQPQRVPLFIPHLEHLVGYALRSCFWTRGFVDVHAAFVRYRDKGVALIGPRGAGKTSLAMHLLQGGGAILGSDMAQLRLGDDGGIIAHAIPHMYRITRETIWDNSLLEAVIGSQFDANTDYLRGPLFSHGKYEAYDPSMQRLVGRRVALSTMAVDGLIFPNFSTDAHQAIEPLPALSGTQRLFRSITHDRPLADWLPFDLASRDSAERVFMDALGGADSPSIKSFDFHFGKQTSLRWDDIDTMFDRL